jgi:hypothetical protein
MTGDQSANRADVLITGGRERRRRLPRFLVPVLVVVVLIGYGAVTFDRDSRHHEFKALLTATVNGQATAAHADATLESTRQYTMPLLGSAQANVRAGLLQLIDQSASQGVTQVRATRAAVASTSVLPWHTSMHKAKAAELAYLDEWAAYLDAVAHGADTGTIPTAALEAKQTGAATALRDAAPDRTASLAIPSSL